MKPGVGPESNRFGAAGVGGTFGDEIGKELILFYKADENGYKQAIPGIKMKTLVYGEKTLFRNSGWRQTVYCPDTLIPMSKPAI